MSTARRTPSPSRERSRDAYHEAGHVAVAFLFGMAIDVVSILPEGVTGGMAFCAGVTWASEHAQNFRPELEVVQQPRDLRDAVERDIIVSLAGVYAERLAPRPEPVELIPPDVDAAERRAADLSHLSPRHRELIVDAAAAVTLQDDDRAAATREAEILGGFEARSYVQWLSEVAARLVQDEAAPLIRALAPELERRIVIPGDDVRALFDEARPWATRKDNTA